MFAQARSLRLPVADADVEVLELVEDQRVAPRNRAHFHEPPPMRRSIDEPVGHVRFERDQVLARTGARRTSACKRWSGSHRLRSPTPSSQLSATLMLASSPEPATRSGSVAEATSTTEPPLDARARIDGRPSGRDLDFGADGGLAGMDGGRGGSGDR